MIVSIDKKVITKPKFISLCSDTTFKYLYKNIKTRSWLNNIIKELFGICPIARNTPLVSSVNPSMLLSIVNLNPCKFSSSSTMNL